MESLHKEIKSSIINYLEMAFIGSHNRFNEFRDDFIKDTGLQNVEENMSLYIQYVSARFADQNHRLLTNLTHEIQDLSKAMKKV